MPGPSSPFPPQSPGSCASGSLRVRAPRCSRSARAPTSAQVLSPRQQCQQQVAACRLPTRVQLPARLHGSRRLAPRLSGPNFPGVRGGHRHGGPRPASERIPALLGAEPAGCRGARSLQRRGGRSGLGAGPRRGAGPGVAEAPRGRPPALRACAPRPAGPDATPGCLARGPGRAGEEPGLGCPRALSRAPQRPARHRPRAEDWAPG